MSKRLGAKLALTVAILGTATLLQGCGDDDDRVFWYSPYMPCIPGVTLGPGGGSVAGPASPSTTGQDQSNPTGGASAAAAGGGGSNQTSGGAGF